MKVGIVTHYSLFNYGSFLQAFAMQRLLSDLGYAPEFIRLRHWRHAWLRYREVLSLSPRGLPFDLRVCKAFSQALAALNTRGRADERYPTIVIGSDEVWNVVNRSFYHFPQFFGRDLNADRIVAYGPSAGRSTYDHLARVPGAIHGIAAMDRLSARDDNACAVVEKITGTRPAKVLDPVLLVDWQGEEVGTRLGGYLLVYIHHLQEEERRQVVEFARRRGLRIVIPCYYDTWGDYNLPAGPFEFLGLVRNAAFVITDRFHGILFSVLYGKPFASFGTQKLKVRAALEDLKLKDRTLGNGHTLEEVLERPMDYTDTMRTIEHGRRTSIQYLENALHAQGSSD